MLWLHMRAMILGHGSFDCCGDILFVIDNKLGLFLSIIKTSCSLSKTYVWLQPPATYHRFCIRHLKSNFNKKFLNSDLENLMWLAATENQLKKFRQRMEQIKTLSHAAHLWLANLPLEKWTMHKEDGYRWGALTANIHLSYHSLLMKAHELPVTATVRLTFKSIIDRFDERCRLAVALIQMQVEEMCMYSLVEKRNVHVGNGEIIICHAHMPLKLVISVALSQWTTLASTTVAGFTIKRILGNFFPLVKRHIGHLPPLIYLQILNVHEPKKCSILLLLA
ncbi:uncharacterized protein LOC107025648 [Solanum pennellii]|uniref:Uncharacterized protein LOC107025648 n=1 Tax=Solanum pennellii TaxID=28526 RepID=A0ABM1H8E5_SOLPN|nr:uncharacterized protein LOC107025648 [Solanum pennellii]